MNIEDIKSGILNRIKSTQKYSRITKEKIMEWINELPSDYFTPHTITEDKAEVNRGMLFDRKVSEIIDYLSQYKDYILEERWPSYEDNEFVLVINRPETSDEIVRRLCLIVESRCDDLLRKEEEIARIDKEILKLKNRKRDILTITNCEE